MADDEIIPDDKDWTWVLDRPCPECGFAPGEVERTDVSDLLRSTARRLADTATGAAAIHRSRPDRWSALEYVAHVRDVHVLYLERLTMMLEQDDPLYPNWDQDATAVDHDYAGQDPHAVAEAVVGTADRLADAFDELDPAQWERAGRRSDGASFTVDSFARYLVHDPIHHLWDVTGQRADS